MKYLREKCVVAEIPAAYNPCALRHYDEYGNEQSIRNN